MSEFIPVDFDSAVEAKPAPGGRYNLQIVACDLTKSGEQSKVPGSPQFKVSLGFQDQQDTPNVTHFISLPNGQEDENSRKFKVLLLKRFLEAFKVPYDRSGIDPARMAMEMVGSTANLEVKLSDPDDSGNVYNRIVVPRLRSED